MVKPAIANEASAQATALWYAAARECVLNTEELPERGPGDCLVRTLWSGISRGTERLVFEGRVPESEYERMRAPFSRARSRFR